MIDFKVYLKILIRRLEKKLLTASLQYVHIKNSFCQMPLFVFFFVCRIIIHDINLEPTFASLLLLRDLDNANAFMPLRCNYV